MDSLTRLVVAAVAMGALVACSGEDAGDEGRDTSTPSIAASEEFNGSDVRFATDLIQHHAQALLMVDLTREREVSPAVARLADRILAAQGPEIELMTDWLTEWDQPVPETVRDHANAHGGGGAEIDPDLPGMMSEEQLAALEEAGEVEFEQLWLELMIEHHQGAIEMAEAEQEGGEYQPAVDLAGTIAATQQAEVDRMEELLGS